MEYWKERLKRLESLPLPVDGPSPTVRSFRAGQESRLLELGLVKALRARDAQHGTTLFMNLLSAYQVLLAEWTGSADIAVGSPLANRNRSETEPLIGFFVNTVVLRGDVSSDPKLARASRQGPDDRPRGASAPGAPIRGFDSGAAAAMGSGRFAALPVWILLESPALLPRGEASLEVAEIQVPVALSR